MYSIYFRFFLLALVDFIVCFELIPERANVTYINEKYISYAVSNVRRAGRRLPYCINFEIKIKHTWANNVTCHFYIYEYLHNEYRRSFLEFHFKFCDFVNKEPYFGHALVTQFGIKCPVVAGTYKLMNITFPMQNFPNVVPFEKARALAECEHNENGDMMYKGQVDILLKNDPRGPPQKRKP